MKHIYIFTLLIFAAKGLLAQPSSDTFPDFTETDINGVEHSLYADYLDQGKVVVIDIFATWCPNCIASLPGLHELEEEYGEDVVLLSFEKDASTSNEASWATTHNVTNPIFSNSISTMSNWNTIAQPNFFVICTDGSFELKVGGIGSNTAPLDGWVEECEVDIIDSVDELREIDFSITTNPIGATLEFQSNINNGSYSVMNLTGKTVLEGTFETSANSIDASSLEVGLYFLQVSTGNDMAVKKFIKR